MTLLADRSVVAGLTPGEALDVLLGDVGDPAAPDVPVAQRELWWLRHADAEIRRRGLAEWVEEAPDEVRRCAEAAGRTGLDGHRQILEAALGVPTPPVRGAAGVDGPGLLDELDDRWLELDDDRPLTERLWCWALQRPSDVFAGEVEDPGSGWERLLELAGRLAVSRRWSDRVRAAELADGVRAAAARAGAEDLAAAAEALVARAAPPSGSRRPGPVGPVAAAG